jgi:hypothetical protein
MSIRLSEAEAWAELERAHTGIFTTLQRNGWPISLPMWFVALDRHIALSWSCGHSPAHDRKCPTVAYRLMSTPISAMITGAAVAVTPPG